MKQSTEIFFHRLREVVESYPKGLYSKAQRAVSSLPEYKKILSLTPFSRPYYSPFNPVFSFELPLVKRNTPYPVYLFRDGRFDLANFFKKNRQLKGPLKDSFLLFHASLFDIVPKKWRTNACFYEIRTKRREKRNALLLVGIFNGSHFGKDYLRMIKKKTSPFIKAGGKIRSCPLVRENAYPPKDRYTTLHPLIETFNDFFHIFGSEVELVDEKNVVRISDMADSYYLFLREDDTLFTDNYLEHYFLLHGGRPFWQQKFIKHPDFSFDLSFDYKIVASRLPTLSGF